MIAEHFLFLDIETLPTDRAEFIDEAVASVKCPASYKKEESIAEWWVEHGEAAQKAAIHKTGLNGGLGRLASIAWGWGNGKIVSAHTAIDGIHSVDQERRILTGFFAECDAAYKRISAAPTIVGHFVTGFDIRWIWHRAIVVGVTPPWWWPVNAKPWDGDAVQDTAVMWAGHRDHISLDRLATILGIVGKGDMHGSEVWDAWERGEHDRIRLYCADDVRIAREIWCRIAGEDAPVEDEVVAETAAVVGAEVEVPVMHPDPVKVPVEVAVEQPVMEAVVEKPVVQRPKVMPVFLQDDFPETEAA